MIVQAKTNRIIDSNEINYHFFFKFNLEHPKSFLSHTILKKY